MLNINYNRTNYIYKNENSITIELSADIIHMFENNIKSEKIQKCIIKELNTNIQTYKNQINNRFFCKTENVNNITIKPYDDMYKFCIKKYINNDTELYEKTNRNLLPCNKINVLIYLWFLNNNTITFWNNYKIDINAGTLIIFPVSICFPYNFEKMDKYVIQGYIYN
jgi:hypothetical protein